MTKSKSNHALFTPWYTRLGNRLRNFPSGLARGANHPPATSGAAGAALVSAAFACFVMMVNQHFTSIFKSWNEIIWNLGSWIPGSRNPDPLYGEIGSYSGKETVLLITWLVSWFILARLWRNRELKTKTIFSYLFFFLVAATVMNWHPLFPYLPLMPK
ncbi:hypothetical protein IQ255_15880 [Pleurocapsales cyanobacterium LEGE 10410]|nr:hypothetical protein [Pleurocapsales cyanobacterium LEGE 10410]